jgi:hypothetical protein
MTLLDGPDFYGTTIFCDDIRHEAGNKITFVGTYKRSLRIHGEFPFSLPKFGLGITYIQRSTAFIKPNKFLVYMPGDGDTASIEADYTDEVPADAFDLRHDIKENEAIVTLGAQLLFSPFLIKEPGLIKVRVTRGDDLVRLGAIEVKPAAGAGPPAA